MRTHTVISASYILSYHERGEEIKVTNPAEGEGVRDTLYPTTEYRTCPECKVRVRGRHECGAPQQQVARLANVVVNMKERKRG